MRFNEPGDEGGVVVISRVGRVITLAFLDAVTVAAAVTVSYGLRFEGIIPERYVGQIPWLAAVAALVRIGLLFGLGLYSSIWAYASLSELFRLVSAVWIGTFVIWLADLWLLPFHVPRSVLIIEGLLTTAAFVGGRAALRFRAERQKVRSGRKGTSETGKRVLIVGAGDAGALVVREIRNNTTWTIVGLIDDDHGKRGQRIHGIPVVGGRSDIPEVVRRFGVTEIVIAMPSVSRQVIRETVEICRQVHVRVRTLPAIYELINGKVSVSAIREVRIEDLLGREPVRVSEVGIARYLRGKRVLVTGAGGSIGGELCRQVARYAPSELILFGRGENTIFMIDQELQRARPEVYRRLIIGDIRDRIKVARVFADYRPEVVFHAAAHKHVPLMEANPEEAFTNNVLGTLCLVEAARVFGVERFVLISTDKAVEPANAMGASKRLAEMVIQAAADDLLEEMVDAIGGDCWEPLAKCLPGGDVMGQVATGADGRAGESVPGAWNGQTSGRSRFVAVRFGNVLGSRGSVVEVFKKQIAEGGPVTVTDPDMRRYFMTIPEAVQLVLQAAAIGEGGELFVLDMGEPVRIIDLAREMIRLSGFEPEVDIPIEIVGRRPGEKLHETLVDDGERVEPTEHPKIMRVRSGRVDARAVGDAVRQLILATQAAVPPQEFKALLLRAVQATMESQKLPLARANVASNEEVGNRAGYNT